jgi:vitamin B12 transporter
MSLVKLTLFSLSALAFSSQAGMAQEGVDDEIIITGTKIPTALEDAVTAVSVITADDIEIGQIRLLSDALILTPGVQVNRSGSFGGVTSVSIRGLPSELTKLVVDGVEVNDPSTFENSFDLATFDTADIERVEILRGPQSTLYGSDAIAGVINVVTRTASDGLSGKAYVEGGSFGTIRGSATVRGGNEILSGAATFSGAYTDGISAADKDNGNEENDAARYLKFSSKLHFAPVEDISLDGVLRYRDTRVEFDEFDFFLGPIDADNVTKTEEWLGAVFLNIGTLDGRLNHRLSVAYNKAEREDIATFAFDGEGERLSYEYQGDFKLNHKATLLFGAERETDKSQVFLGFGASDEIHITSGYGLAQVQPVEWLDLSFGLRHDANSRFGGETTASGGGAIHLPYNVKLRGSYQEGFRAPTTSELSFNSDLDPEKSTGWDIGLEMAFNRDDIRFAATYFSQGVTDLISFDPLLFIPVNLESYESEGVEVTASYSPVEELSFEGSYTYTDARNISLDSRALRQPKHRALLTINYRPIEKLQLSTRVYFNGRELDFGQVDVDRFTTVSFNASYGLSESVEIFGRVENLTDKNYQDIAGFGTPGASAYGGIRTRF